jgi:ABC-type glycerol-3-phosphate transport system substrate-binding protein
MPIQDKREEVTIEDVQPCSLKENKGNALPPLAKNENRIIQKQIISDRNQRNVTQKQSDEENPESVDSEDGSQDSSVRVGAFHVSTMAVAPREFFDDSIGDRESMDGIVIASGVCLVEDLSVDGSCTQFDMLPTFVSAEKIKNFSLFIGEKRIQPKRWQIISCFGFILLAISAVIIPILLAKSMSHSTNPSHEAVTVSVLIHCHSKEKIIIEPYALKFESMYNKSNEHIGSVKIILSEFDKNLWKVLTASTETLEGISGFINFPREMSLLSQTDIVDELDDKDTFEDPGDIMPVHRDLFSYDYKGGRSFIPFGSGVDLYYYRKDLFERYNITVPRTWDEYNEIAKFFHGMKDPVDNKTDLTGSCSLSSNFCPARVNNGENYRLIQDRILSSITLTKQTQVSGKYVLRTEEDGTQSVVPILGEAFKEALRIAREQFKYRVTPPEGDCSWINYRAPWPGNCVQNIYSSFQYLRHLSPESNFKGKRKIGIGQLPGSSKVLDRRSGTLVECNKTICPNAVYYEDIGKWVNSPTRHSFPLRGAISKQAKGLERNVTMQFFNFLSNKENSVDYAIPIANATVNDFYNEYYNNEGLFPFRYSHFKSRIWLSQGYDEESVTEYTRIMYKSLSSKHHAPIEHFSSDNCLGEKVDKPINYFLNVSSTMTELQFEEAFKQLEYDLYYSITTYMKLCDSAHYEHLVTTEDVYMMLRSRNQQMFGNED